MSSSTATELMGLLDKLKAERAEYVTKIEEIDATFVSLGAAIPGAAIPGAVPAAGAASATKPGPGRKRKSFAKTADESVLDFIKGNPKATSADVNAHWQQEGRGGRADNTLTKLVKAGKLKRSPIPGQSRGGTYTAV